MAVRGIHTFINQGIITISVQAPPPELAEGLEVINETGEIILAGMPAEDGCVFLLVTPGNTTPNFGECLNAAMVIAEAARLTERDVDHIALLLGVVAHDAQQRTLVYRVSDGQEIANIAATLIEKYLGDSDAIESGIISAVMNSLQNASENTNGFQAQEQDDAQIRGERQDQLAAG